MTAPVPIAYFAYRRTDLAARTLDALRVNGARLIYAYSDGPRPGDEAAVGEVRRMLRSITWADVRLVERESNLGLDPSIVDGITRTLAEHDEIVVCEDDIEFAPGAIRYLLAALDHYRFDPRVMCIGGWANPRVTPADVMDAPHFTGRFNCWGWATRRQSWEGFCELSPHELRDRCIARGIDLAKYGSDVAESLAGDESQVTWDYKFSAYMLLRGGLSLMPPHSLAAHIGYDERASHPQDGSDWVDHLEPAPAPDAITWPEVRDHPESAALWRRALDPAPRSFAGRLRRRLSRLLGASQRQETES